MSSLIIPPHHFLVPPRLVGHLNFQTIYLPLTVVISPRSYRRQQGPHPSVCFHLQRSFLGFGNSKSRHYYQGCCCSKGWESEEDFTLETEILEFMKKSEKPEVFPTKEELVDAGRMDLVEGIVKKGGWLSMGWDLCDENKEEEVQVIDIIDRDCDDSYGLSSVSSDYSHSPSSSGRSFGMKDEQETGIEGILTRLEKQRNLSFVTGLGVNGYSALAVSKDGIGESHIETSNYWDSGDFVSSSRLASESHNNGIINNSGSKLSHSRSVTDFGGSMSSVTSETWQSWSIRRAGFSNSEFEAAEISFINNEMDEGKGASDAESLNKQKDTSNNDIRTRLHHLEVELSSALSVLRSKSVEYVPKEVRESSNDLRELSDALEFQENEIMKAKDRLRSIRAKLAVLEGKMTLAIIDAQKITEVKQKKIDGGSRALHLLRTTCVVWPNSASEVLLAGSFDGWTTQRKMEKSSAGIFSLCLKLYPGRYEIKFIVDGIWKTDPLRPIVRNNGYENNLLIIT